MILDGGAVMVGVESTIIDFTEIVPVILRPGWITKESMEEFLGCEVLMNTSLKASDHGIPRAPGMKYKHYAPKAEMVLVLGDDQEKVVNHINQLAKEQKEQGKKIGIIASDETKDLYQADEVVSVGQRAHLAGGIKKLGKLERFQKYIDTLGNHTYCNFEQLSAAVNKPVKFVTVIAPASQFFSQRRHPIHPA